ncbi:MAG: hypothetical protein AAGC47_04215, partial [Bacteroidota bacterium]
EDEDSPLDTGDTGDNPPVSMMVLVLEGDTISVDSVYTRRTSRDHYQIAGIDPQGVTVLITIRAFQGEFIYSTAPDFNNPLDPFDTRIEVRNYNGASYYAEVLPAALVNVTDYSSVEGSVSGTFEGVLTNKDDNSQTLEIDTAYFVNVNPIQLNTEEGKVDFFYDGILYRDLDVPAEIFANNTLRIGPFGLDIWTLPSTISINDITPNDGALGSLLFLVTCYPEYALENIEDLFVVEVDSSASTISGFLKHRYFFDTEVYFNKIPVQLPDFPTVSDGLNLSYNGELITFDSYVIEGERFISGSPSLVSAEAWSSSGLYLKLSMTGNLDDNPFVCEFFDYTSTLELFENENSPEPIATIVGSGNITPRNTVEGLGELGFTSDEAELNGLGLDLTWTFE